jgi:hypothetical protein
VAPDGTTARKKAAALLLARSASEWVCDRIFAGALRAKLAMAPELEAAPF